MSNNPFQCVIDYQIDLTLYDTNDVDIQQIADYTMSYLASASQISLNHVSEQQMQKLNMTYRQKDKPTNVLTFVYPPHESHHDLMRGVDNFYYGEIFLCHHIIQQEAIAQCKPLSSHCKHIFIHALLHLCGYDHETDQDAQVMEGIEIDILKHFHIQNPYLS